jgi:hypothetical protein
MTPCDSAPSGRQVMPFVTVLASGMSKGVPPRSKSGTGIAWLALG